MLDPERCWQALCERDARYDGRFVFAVRSTGIFSSRGDRPAVGMPGRHRPRVRRC